MSYICDVCGPRLDCHSILCKNCDIGIICEINTKGDVMPMQALDVHTGSDVEIEEKAAVCA